MCAYFGAGSPSASHSMINGLSFSSILCATWKRSSSEGGCLTICGGDWTVRRNKREKQKINFNSRQNNKTKKNTPDERKLSVYCIDTLVASRADFRDSSAKLSPVAFIHMKRVSSLTTDYLLFIPFFSFFSVSTFIFLFNLVGVHHTIYLPIAVVEAM